MQLYETVIYRVQCLRDDEWCTVTEPHDCLADALKALGRKRAASRGQEVYDSGWRVIKIR